MNTKPVFEDLEAVNRINAGRFDLPPLARRQNIAAGKLVRLATAVSAHHWVWIEVTERTPYGYRGIVDVAPGSESSCPVAVGDVVDFIARNVLEIHTRQATTSAATYEQLLADAETLDAAKSWDAVSRIESARMAERCLPDAQGADYLRANPSCIACDAKGIKADATAATITHGALCRNCLYVLTATEMRWPVRGCDIAGWPNDPDRREGKH